MQSGCHRDVIAFRGRRGTEGDVGSGKTVVAATAMFAAHLNGLRSALMAPTEVLAQQHYKEIKKMLAPFDVTVGLTTGTAKPSNPNSQFSILIS